jgi:beta-glucuronidase
MLYPQRTRTRTCFELNGIWGFSREKEGGDYASGFAAEHQVAVPGSFNDLFTDGEMRMWFKGVWCERRFFMATVFADQRVVLRFGSVNYHATVYLNGVRLGEHETGYTPFEFDITDTVSFDQENVLCVRIDNVLSRDTVPMGNLGNKPEDGQIGGQYPDVPFDFFPYMGIHRPVCVYTTGKKAWLDSVQVDTLFEETTGRLSLQGKICGSASSVKISILETEVSETVEARAGRFSGKLSILDVKLWDIDSPNLYKARMQVLDGDGNLLDEYIQRFGIRTVKMEGNQFLLNGKSVYLKGFGRHEDFPILGKGLNHSVNIRDHELMKWINANSYRTTHYPYSEELVQLADEQGFLLIAEAPAVSVHLDYTTDRTLEVHKQVMTELIQRDYNSPSVIMWSVANEATTDREDARVYFKQMADLVRAEDLSRPVMMVTCKAKDDLVLEYFDVVGINTYPGWYYLPGQIEAAKEKLHSLLIEIHNECGKPILVSEFGGDAIAGFHSLPAEQWSEEYQADLLLGLIDTMRELDFVIGEHVWNFADFRTAQHCTRAGGNKKGVFTRDRQPKMAARFLKMRWAETDKQKG